MISKTANLFWNFTKQVLVHSFSSNPPGVLPHPKDLACFASFYKFTRRNPACFWFFTSYVHPKLSKNLSKNLSETTHNLHGVPLFFRQSTTALPWTPRLPSVRWRTRRAPSWSSCGCQGELIGEKWANCYHLRSPKKWPPSTLAMIWKNHKNITPTELCFLHMILYTGGFLRYLGSPDHPVVMDDREFAWNYRYGMIWRFLES